MRTRANTVLAAGVILVALLVPAAASAGQAYRAAPRIETRVSASAVTSDAYEPDDSTSTAKPWPLTSVHTFTYWDVDAALLTVTETGTPYVVETRALGGMAEPMSALYFVGADGTPASAGVGGFNMFGGAVFPQSWLYRCDGPGTYNLVTANVFGSAGGKYDVYLRKGLSRRIAGTDRFASAAAVSRQVWPDVPSAFDEFQVELGSPDALSPRGVIVANARNFPDALAAGAWGAMGAQDGEHLPLLLTDRFTLPKSTKDEILRLAGMRRRTAQPFTVYVVGGSGMVDASVMNAIRDLPSSESWTRPVTSVVRIAGSTRFDTAVRIAEEASAALGPLGDHVFLTNGFRFQEALAAGPVAAHAAAPLLLSAAATLPPATAAYLQSRASEIATVVVVGDGSQVATSVLDALAAPPYGFGVVRLAGKDVYETALETARWGLDSGGTETRSLTVVTGENFPDGLAACGLTGFTRGPVLLTRGAALSSQVATYYAEIGGTLSPSYLVGGTGVMSATVQESFDDLWGMSLPD